MVQADMGATPPPTLPRGWDGEVELVTIPGAAKLAGVSRRTIYNWARQGKIATRYTPSRHLRIVVASLWHTERPELPATGTDGQ